MHQTRTNVAWGACLLGVVLLVMPLPPPGHLGWMPLLRDACHAALFALLAWAWMGWRQAVLPSAGRAAAETASVLLVLAAGTEVAQAFTGRSMDMGDFIRDVAGMGAGILATLLPRAGGPAAKAALLGVFLVLGVFASWDVIQRARLVWHKAAGFPLLEDFEDPQALRLWQVEHEGIRMQLQRAPAKLPAAGQALQLAIPPHGLTSLHGDVLGRDWSGWTHLVFDSHLEAAAPLLLGVRIDNAAEPRRRTALQVTLQPGAMVAVVALPPDPETQGLLRQAGEVVLYAENPGQAAALQLDNLRLERR